MVRDPAGGGPLDTDGGRAVAVDVVELLESELVRFCHRVRHDYAISLDRARAALVLLTKLVASGVEWNASADSAPRYIFDRFVELITRAETTWPSGLAEALHAELAEFISVTSRVAVAELPERPSFSELVRDSGAAPDAWWWASQFDDLGAAWQAASSSSERLIEIAFALGVSGDAVGRSLAGALAVGAGRAKTKRAAQRKDLVTLLTRLQAAGVDALVSDGGSISKVTALAFEMMATQERDGIAELALLAFQLIELFRITNRTPDPERYCDIASRAQRILIAQGVQLAGCLKRDLEPAIVEAAR